uniref:Uncharacterized protein n=1 Tax=Tetraselmis sp. GSL018 TaxID=582737 RepID=A0A061RVB9_9CHLO
MRKRIVSPLAGRVRPRSLWLLSRPWSGPPVPRLERGRFARRSSRPSSRGIAAVLAAYHRTARGDEK